MRTRGVGPSPCPYLLVSDYPGYKEAQTGIPLIGKTGDEVNRRLDGVKLPAREDWFIVNLIREYRADGEYDTSDVARDEAELQADIARVRPQLIVTLGRWSARWFLGDVNLDEVQALPWLWPVDPSVVIFPITNPAAGFRSPEVQSQVDHGFRELSLYFEGKVEPRELFKDAYPEPRYTELTTARAVVDSVRGVRELAIDTEGHPSRIWSVQWSTEAGAASMVRVANRVAVLAFVDWLVHEKPRVTFHGSLHDFGIFRALLVSLGYPVDALYRIPFDDSQIMAYLLQLEPIGLKPNCVRHCNMAMQDYTEVLGDAQLVKAQDYLVTIFDHEQALYEARQRDEFARINASPILDASGQPKRRKDGSVRYRRTTVLPQVPKTDLHKAALRVLGSATPYKLWQDQREDIRVAAYNIEV